MSPESDFPWGLLASAAIITLMGGCSAYLLSLLHGHPNARLAMIAVFALTMLGAGLCVILALARWWIRR